MTPAPPGPRPVVESGFSLVVIVAAVLCATLIQTLDATIVNVSLPVIQGNLGATIDEGAWVVTAYIIAAVIVIPLMPWLQTRFGRRQYYVAAIVGFTVSSVLCGISHSIGELIAWRFVQGAFGGGLIATAQATLRDTFPKEKIGLSQGLFSMGAILGPALGPVLGGWLTDNFSWNWVFLVNIVPGAFASTVLFFRLKNPMEPQRVNLDTVGLLLLILGLGSLQYVLGEGQRLDWFDDTAIVAATSIGVCSMAAFVAWELFGTTHPIVDLRILRFRAVSAGAALAFGVGLTFYGSMVIFPQYLESVLGFTATDSGELVFSRALFIAIGTPFIVRLATNKRVDTRLLVLLGFLLVAISHVWLALVTTSQTEFSTFLAPNMLCGIGLSMLFVPISLAILGGVPQLLGPKAAAFQQLSTQLGGSISTAALVTILARREALHQDQLAANMRLSFQPVANLVLHHASLIQLYRNVMTEVSAISYADAQLTIGIAAFALLPIVFILPRKKSPPAVVVVPKPALRIASLSGAAASSTSARVELVR